MNTAFKKASNYFKAITVVLTAAVMSLSAAVFAAGAESAELSAAGDRAEVNLTLPQAAAEGISSIQISLNVETNTDNAEITFVPNEKLNAKIQESRYHKDTGVLNIYTVGTTPLFDKSDPTLTLGYVKISSNEVNGAAANVAFVKGSLKYVRGGVLEVYDNGLSYSGAVKISVGNGGVSEPPEITDSPVVTEKEPPEAPVETQAPVQTQPPVETAEPPVVIDPSGNDGEEKPQPADLSELSEAVKTAEGFKAEDYTEESFKVLQQAIAQAKEILNSSSPSPEQAEEARMLLENAIGMLTKRTEQPVGDVTTAQNAESTSVQGGDNPPSGESTSPDDNAAVTAGADSSSPSDTEGGDKADNDKGGLSPLVIVLIVVGVVLAGLGVGIGITLNKRKDKGGKHSK